FVSAAHVQLYIAGRGNFFGRDGIQLKAHVETTGIVSATLLSVDDDYTTYIAPESGLPYHRQQIVREGGRSSEAAFDFNQAAVADRGEKARRGDLAGIYDLLSIIYRMRATPLAAGTSYFVPVRTATQDTSAEIKVTGKQSIQTGQGSIDA